MRMPFIFLALASLVLAQDTTTNNTSASISTPTASASQSTNNTASVNSTVSATGNSTTGGAANQTLSISTGSSTTVRITATAGTPTWATASYTALAPGASGTIATGPDDSYIAAAGRLMMDSKTLGVVGTLGAVVVGVGMML